MNRRQTLLSLPAMAISVSLPHATALAVAPSPTMQARKIPASGEAIPVIGLGTWQTFDVGADARARAPLEAVLREFVALGGRVIDSSPMYGRSEEVAGDLMAALGVREKLFVATKVWTQGRAPGITQMRESLQKLRVPKDQAIDLMQVHNLVDVQSHLATLAEWKREKRVRYIGITHYTESAYADVARVIESQKTNAIDFLQINYSVGERDAEKRLLPLARERGMAVIVNRPFAGGELIRRLRAMPLPAVARELECASWAQILLKFVLGHAAVTCAIPATSKVEHLRDNMQAGRGAMPNDTQRAQILASIS